jgi:hypothetical protein
MALGSQALQRSIATRQRDLAGTILLPEDVTLFASCELAKEKNE